MTETDLVLSVVISIAIVFSCYLIYNSIVEFVKGLYSEEWPTVQGIIVESKIQKLYHRDKYEKEFKNKLTYKYVVNGVEYENSNFSFSGFFGAPTTAEEAIEVQNRFEVGKNLTVRYNVNNPTESTIYGVGYKALISQFVFGVIILIFSIHTLKEIL